MPSEVTRDLSCPNGCFDLEVSATHGLGETEAEDLLDESVRDDRTCPRCGHEFNGENDAN
jgi:hypothetical protein